jgi:hypothetical protein
MKKIYSEQELAGIRRVFGENVQFSSDTGLPIEQGVGSPSQLLPNPTSKPSLSPTPEQLTTLHRIVASMGNAELSRDFDRFVAYRKEFPDQQILDMPLELVVADPGHLALDETKVNLFRSWLRAEKRPLPISVHPKNADGIYQIIEGHYRVASARLENHKTIRASIVKPRESNRS